MLELPDRLLRTIRKQVYMRAGDRVAVAVSGGADSVALLLLLAELREELGIVLSVAHVNHKLRGEESDADQRFVAELAARLGYELYVVEAPVRPNPAASAGRAKSGIEAEARRLRYEFFRQLIHSGRATKVATAHTLDDQAETVLLRMFRGSGIRGLAGIYPRLRLDSPRMPRHERTSVEIVRPLLGFRRSELREYLRDRGQTWREDSSNEDVVYLRNRVRQQLLPFIAKEFGEAAIEHIAELAEIARAEEEWAAERLAGGTGQSVPQPARSVASSAPVIEVAALLTLPEAAARRVVRDWIEANAPGAGISFRIVEAVLDLARGPAGRELALPGTAKDGTLVVCRGQKELTLKIGIGDASRDYEYLLAIPGEITIPELECRLEAQLVNVEDVATSERFALLNPDRIGASMLVRNWRAGDRYWPAQTSGEKKVKELLSDRHAAGVDKKLWPVAVAAGQLVWMRGFPAPQAWHVQAGKAIWLRELKG